MDSKQNPPKTTPCSPKGRTPKQVKAPRSGAKSTGVSTNSHKRGPQG